MPEIIFDYKHNNLYVIRNGQKIDIRFDSALKYERGLIDTLKILDCFTSEFPPFELPVEMLNTIHHNNAIHALITRLKQLDGYDVSKALYELRIYLDPEDIIYTYVPDPYAKID